MPTLTLEEMVHEAQLRVRAAVVSSAAAIKEALSLPHDDGPDIAAAEHRVMEAEDRHWERAEQRDVEQWRRTHSWLDAARSHHPGCAEDPHALAREAVARHTQLCDDVEGAGAHETRAHQAERDEAYECMFAALARLTDEGVAKALLAADPATCGGGVQPRDPSLMTTLLAEIRRKDRYNHEVGNVIDSAWLVNIHEDWSMTAEPALRGVEDVRQRADAAMRRLTDEGVVATYPAAAAWLWERLAYLAPASVEGATGLIRAVESRGFMVPLNRSEVQARYTTDSLPVWEGAVRMHLMTKSMHAVIAHAALDETEQADRQPPRRRSRRL